MGFLSLMVQVLGLVAAALTLMWRRRQWALAMEPVLGLLADIVARKSSSSAEVRGASDVLGIPFAAWSFHG
jgi:hypothetical protein